MRKQRQDLTGLCFGNLTVVSPAEDRVVYYNNRRSTAPRWNCICCCGNKKIATSSDLRGGSISSCGCLRGRHHNRVFKKPFGVSAFGEVHRGYKRGAKARGYLWDITTEQFKELIEKPRHYCGSKKNNTTKNKPSRHGEYSYTGIDRVDNSIGYIIGNLVPCCKICNIAKRNLSVDDFNKWITQLVVFQNGKYNRDNQ